MKAHLLFWLWWNAHWFFDCWWQDTCTSPCPVGRSSGYEEMHYQRKSLRWIVTSCCCSVDLTGRFPVYNCGSRHSVWTSIWSHLQLLQRHMVGHNLLRTCRLPGHLELWRRVRFYKRLEGFTLKSAKESDFL